MDSEAGGRQDAAGLEAGEPTLRQRTGTQARSLEVENGRTLLPQEAQQLIHELQVRQVELELKNQELRRTQDELSASLSRYADLFDHAPLGYLTLSQDGLILEANLTAATALGVPRDELAQQPLVRSIVPEDEEIYRRHRERLFETGERQACELRMVRQGPQSSQFWARLVSILAQDGGYGTPVCRVTLSDITERRRAEQQLVQQHRFLQNALDSLSHPFYVINVKDRTVEAANKAAYRARLAGGVTCYALLHGRDQPCEEAGYPCPLQEILSTKQPAVMEHIHLDQEGRSRYVEVHGFPVADGEGNVVQMIEYTLDITDRKRSEQALRDQDEKLRTLFEILPIGISVLDSSRTIQLTNPALARILGLSQDELRSGAYARRTYVRADGTEIPPGELPSVRAVREGRSVRDVEVGVVKEDGEQIWTNVSAVPLPFDDWSVIITTADITRQKRAELALQQAHSELERRVDERTAELLGLTELLRTEIAERKGVEEDLRTSEERFRQLADHINQVFWITDLATGQPLYISPAYEDLSGQAPQRVFDEPDSFLQSIHPEDHERVLLALEQGTQQDQAVQCRLVRPDGSIPWVQIRTFPVRDEQGRIYRLAGIAEDITEQVHAVELLERHVADRTRQLSALLQIASSMTLTLELGPLLDLILDGMEMLVAYDAAVVYELVGEELVAVAQRGLGPLEQLASLPVHLQGSARARKALSLQRPILLSHVQGRTDDSLFAPLPDWACCGMAVPLIVRQRDVGLLVIYSRLPDSYSRQQMELLQALANQAAVGIENARLYAQLSALTATEERERLARDLHDSVSQTLFSANIIAEALPRIWDRDPESVRRRLPQLHRLTSGALAEMRTLLLELRPTALVDVEMSELLKQAVDAFSGRTRTEVVLSVAGQHPLPEAVQVALYRIVQEALNNVAKHARATETTILFQSEPDGVVLRIRDNGQGFDLERVPPACMGLHILRERARAIGAVLEITSQPGKGTEIAVVWTATP